MSQGNQTVWTKELVQAQLQRSEAWCARAILGLYARQTATEQSAEQTIEHNGRGFNGRDAEFLSSIAKALPRYNNRMTPRQLRAARRSLLKYWRQILEMIEENGGVVSFKANSPVSEIAPKQIEAPATEGQGFVWS